MLLESGYGKQKVPHVCREAEVCEIRTRLGPMDSELQEEAASLSAEVCL